MPVTDHKDFYSACAGDRTYVQPIPKRKHHRQFDAQFWNASDCRKDMSFLEIGCGTGLFLAYLREKGAEDFIGIDQEERVLEYMPPGLAEHAITATIDDYLESKPEKTFHRIAMFDVFEHFPTQEGVALLERLRSLLAPDGKIVIRVPNLSSPWGLRHHFGDLTHRAAYTPDSIRQAAIAAGYDMVTQAPVTYGGAFKRVLRVLVEKITGWLFADAPEIWSATFITVISPR